MCLEYSNASNKALHCAYIYRPDFLPLAKNDSNPKWNGTLLSLSFFSTEIIVSCLHKHSKRYAALQNPRTILCFLGQISVTDGGAISTKYMAKQKEKMCSSVLCREIYALLNSDWTSGFFLSVHASAQHKYALLLHCAVGCMHVVVLVHAHCAQAHTTSALVLLSSGA